MAWYAYKGRRVTADDSRDPRFEVCDEGWRGAAGSLAACTLRSVLRTELLSTLLPLQAVSANMLASPVWTVAARPSLGV